MTFDRRPASITGPVVRGLHYPPPGVYKIWISGLETGRIQHILNKPDRIRTTVLFMFSDQDQDFQISFFGI